MLPFTLLELLLIGLFSVVLVKSATKMISSSSNLARYFHISEYTISFLVVGIATSLPEFVVGAVSALDKKPILSFGNVVGSNIADLTIIIAVPIFIGGAISTRKLIKNKDLIYAAFFGIMPIALTFDLVLSRFDSLILLISYLFYVFLVLKRTSFFETIIDTLKRTNPYKEFFIFLVSTAFLLISGGVMVKSAESISLSMGVPLVFIGLTITALGTSLPELAFGIKAIKTHHKGEVIGNVVGSVVANSTLVLALTALIEPINVSGGIGVSSIIFLLIVLLLFFVLSVFNRELGKFEAAFLLLTYISFLFVEMYLNF